MGTIYKYQFLAFTGWFLFGWMFLFFLCKPQTIVKENVVKTVTVYKDGKGYSQRQNFILDCVKNAASSAQHEDMDNVVKNCDFVYR